MAHVASSRARKIGIWMALRAESLACYAPDLKQGLTVSALGILIGLPAAAAGSHLIGSLLFEVSVRSRPDHLI